MRAITPVIAIVILILMAIAAAAMAYLMITSFQDQATGAGQTGLETLSTKTKTQLRIEAVSNGRIYVRNLGTVSMSGSNFFVNGRPIDVSGPTECEPGKLCAYTVTQDPECGNECTLSMGADMPLGTTVKTEQSDIYTLITITTFDDGNTTKTLSFEGGDSEEANITLPTDMVVSSATLDLSGSKAWSPYTNVSWTAGTYSSPRTTFDSEGNLHVVFIYTPDGGEDDLAYLNKTAGTWSQKLNITDSGLVYASLDANNNGLVPNSTNDLHLVSVESEPIGFAPVIMYQNKTSTGWSQRMNISNETSSSYPDAAIDPNGILHVVSTDNVLGSQDIFYANRTDGVWSEPFNVSDTIPASVYADIDTDSSGNLHVVWSEGMASPYEIYYANRTAGVWSTPMDISQVGYGTSELPQIDIDASDNLHVVWGFHYSSGGCTTTYEYSIVYANRTGDTWSTENIDYSFSYSNDQPMSEPKLRLDGSGNPHVVWRKGLDPDVYYTSRSAGIWSNISNVSETSDDSVYPSLAVDSNGNAHVLWLESAPAVEVAYKRNSYTQDPSLQAGATGSSDWSYSSYFGTTDTTDDFSDKLNALLADCDCPSCWSNATHCTIGLNFTSDAPGAITLSGLLITS